MQNARPDKSQIVINTAGRSNKLTYADNTTLMAETEKLLLIKLKEESENAGLKLNIQKN